MGGFDQKAQQDVTKSFNEQSVVDPNHISAWQRVKNLFSSSGLTKGQDALSVAIQRKRQELSDESSDE